MNVFLFEPGARVAELEKHGSFFQRGWGFPRGVSPHAKALRPEIIECVIQWLRFCKIHPTVGRVGPNDPQKVVVVGCLLLRETFKVVIIPRFVFKNCVLVSFGGDHLFAVCLLGPIIETPVNIAARKMHRN